MGGYTTWRKKPSVAGVIKTREITTVGPECPFEVIFYCKASAFLDAILTRLREREEREREREREREKERKRERERETKIESLYLLFPESSNDLDKKKNLVIF